MLIANICFPSRLNGVEWSTKWSCPSVLYTDLWVNYSRPSDEYRDCRLAGHCLKIIASPCYLAARRLIHLCTRCMCRNYKYGQLDREVAKNNLQCRQSEAMIDLLIIITRKHVCEMARSRVVRQSSLLISAVIDNFANDIRGPTTLSAS